MATPEQRQDMGKAIVEFEGRYENRINQNGRR
jgi:hypothetical protein